LSSDDVHPAFTPRRTRIERTVLDLLAGKRTVAEYLDVVIAEWALHVELDGRLATTGLARSGGTCGVTTAASDSSCATFATAGRI
jgi:hypothetical protein